MSAACLDAANPGTQTGKSRVTEWTPVADGLPPIQGRKARRRYMVYSPVYGGYAFRCWFAKAGWGCDSVSSMISDVTHWRVARKGEGDGQLPLAELECLTKGPSKQTAHSNDHQGQ
jgi:hypothetical protein